MLGKLRAGAVMQSVALGLGAVGLLLAAWLLVSGRASEPRVALKVSGGALSGLRHRLAERLATSLDRDFARVTVVETAGSEDALARLSRGELDFALVQGGFRPQDFPRVRQVTPLHLEPLHLLVRSDLHERVSANLAALEGRRVNLSDESSGTHALAREVLDFAGLHLEADGLAGSLFVEKKSYADLLAVEGVDRLPDAVFTVSSLPSPVATRLVRDMGYRLVPLPFGEAFSLDALRSHGESSRRIDKMHVYPAEIPAFTYAVEPPVPAGVVPTLGTRLLLLTHVGVDERAVERVVSTVFSPRFRSVHRPPLATGVLQLPEEFPVHAGTERFRRRSKPYITPEELDNLEKTVSISAALVGGLFFVWQWGRRRLRRRREESFADYVRRVAELEHRVLELETMSDLDLEELIRVQEELSYLKSDALARFARGELEGGELMAAFMAQVNDARNYVTRLLLHSRDNLEDQAQATGRSLEELWREKRALQRGEGSSKERPRTQ